MALKAAMVLPPLLLQRPHHRSSNHNNKQCLERCLQLWHDGDLLQLLQEGRTIQQHLQPSKACSSTDTAHIFAQLMFQGKVKAALRLLSSNSWGNFLLLSAKVGDSTVLDELKKKHPCSSPINYDALIDPKLPSSETCHEVIFEGLDGVVIRNSCLKTDGAVGPSGIDAAGWWRMCISFQSASADLFDSLASIARRMASIYVNPHGLSSLLDSRLISLDQNPGIRPIGIGETSRRIISKAILFMVKTDILEAAGNLQLCAGQEAGCEAAIHVMESLFHSSTTQAVLLANASNVFNSLNRNVSLHNLHFICPPLAVTLTNVYREASSLFTDGECQLSEEGTTQGDPLAMAMYALSTVPLIQTFDGLATQVWFADDAAAAGSLVDLLVWWKQLSGLGPGYGYCVNASKSWLVVKEDYYDTACTLFAGTSLRITTEGRPSSRFKSIFLQKKVCQ